MHRVDIDVSVVIERPDIFVKTQSLEVEGPDYARARAALGPLVPEGYRVLSYRTVG